MLPVSSRGCPDYLAAKAGRLALVEVKARGESFRAAQIEFFTALYRAGVPVYVLETEDDVRALTVGSLEPWKPDDVAAVVSRGRGSRARKPRIHQPGRDAARSSSELCSSVWCTTSKASGSAWCLSCGTARQADEVL